MAIRGNGTAATQAPPNTKLVRTLLEVAVLILALILALLIRFTIFEAALVTSESMVPALHKDDRILIDHRASLRGRWQRGDIIIFESPSTWGGDADTLIKRVIGLPGETVQINNGHVYISGQHLNEPYISDAQPIGDDTPPTTLPGGQYFVLGDNRDNSDDSRLNGPVEEKYIRGRAVWRLSPISRFGQIALPRY